jgi:uncharacterized membrane protein
MQVPHNKQRLEAFSDGVFAIAITLLALELHVPQLISHSISGGLHEVWPLLPNILTFVLSFVTIAIFWVNHHQLTQEIGPIRRRILWMNILFLLFITLVPFATNVASSNPSHGLAIMTYAFVMFAGSISFTILRYYVHRSCGEHRVAMQRSYVGPTLYGLAIVSAGFFIPLSYIFLAIPPLFYFLPKARITIEE